MSMHPFPIRKAAQPPVDPYFQIERRPEAPLRLLPLTALEQMYAYWGSDRA
jgi:hypothetical protein